MDDVSSYALYYIEGHKPLFPGVIVRQAYVRDYPQGEIGAVVLGQVGQITGPLSSSHPELGTAPYKGIAAGTIVGQSGLEATYQSYLQGTPGVDHVDVDAAGYPIAAKSNTVQPVAGDQVSTSLDLGLEKEGYIAADEARIKARLNNDPAPAAAFVAIDPFSGHVLALGSVPTYNANAFATTPSKKTYAAILAEDHALLDRAIDGAYPTGSTFKPITALAGLNAGLITAQSLQGNGSCVSFGTTQKFCNSGSANYGNLDLVNALTVSEDTYFYRVGAAANGGSWPIQREARELGLGRSPGIDLPGGGEANVVPDSAYVAALNAQYISQHCRSSSPGSLAKPAYAKQQLAVTACAQGYLQLPWTIGQNVLLATGQGYLLATPAADGGRLLGDRQRRQGVVAADRHRDPLADRRAGRAAAGANLQAGRDQPGLSGARDDRPARRGPEPERHLRPDVRQLPAHRLWQDRHRGSPRPGGPVLVRRLRPRPQAPDRRRGHRRAGRLRRRGGRARGAADPGEVVRPAREGSSRRHRARISDGHKPDPRAATGPRPGDRDATLLSRIGLDPILTLAALGLGVASLVTLGGISHAQMVRQGGYLAVGLVVMVVMSRFDYSRLRELKWGLYVILIGSILVVLAIGTSIGGPRPARSASRSSPSRPPSSARSC